MQGKHSPFTPLFFYFVPWHYFHLFYLISIVLTCSGVFTVELYSNLSIFCSWWLVVWGSDLLITSDCWEFACPLNLAILLCFGMLKNLAFPNWSLHLYLPFPGVHRNWCWWDLQEEKVLKLHWKWVCLTADCWVWETYLIKWKKAFHLTYTSLVS